MAIGSAFSFLEWKRQTFSICLLFSAASSTPPHRRRDLDVQDIHLFVHTVDALHRVVEGIGGNDLVVPQYFHNVPQLLRTLLVERDERALRHLR